MRYVIVGTGAVGGMIGGRLALAGKDTAWVARGEHGRVLREQGLTLLSPDGRETAVAPVWTGPEEAELREGDVIVVAVKSQDVAGAVADWADVPVRLADGGTATAGESLPVVLATNGVAAETIALRYFRRVIGMCVWAPNVFLSPGVVVCRWTPRAAVLHLSRVPARLTDDDDREFLAAISADLAAARIDAPVHEDVMPWKYRKLLNNLGNVVEALTDGGGDDVAHLARTEARQVLAAAGIEMTDDETEARARMAGPRPAPVPGAPERLGGSTWQSLVKGGSQEGDFLNGEIVAIAHAAGLAAPVNTVLARLGRQAAREGVSPGGTSVDELRAAVGAGLR